MSFKTLNTIKGKKSRTQKLSNRNYPKWSTEREKKKDMKK